MVASRIPGKVLEDHLEEGDTRSAFVAQAIGSGDQRDQLGDLHARQVGKEIQELVNLFKIRRMVNTFQQYGVRLEKPRTVRCGWQNLPSGVP